MTLDCPIEEASIVVFDVETTGMDPNKGARICEIAAVKLTGGRMEDTFDTLVNPQTPIDAAAFAVNQISAEMLQQAPTMSDVMPRFQRFIDGCVLAAYNAPFDMEFLKHELMMTSVLFQEPGPAIDVLMVARKCLPNLGRYPLWNVVKYFKIDFPEQHRALKDAQVTAEVFFQLVPMAKQLDVRTVGDFIGVSQQKWSQPKTSSTRA